MKNFLLIALIIALNLLAFPLVINSGSVALMEAASVLNIVSVIVILILGFRNNRNDPGWPPKGPSGNGPHDFFLPD
jgi:hypothetical membrane protein